MKYGVEIDKKNEIIINSAREFEDDQWNKLQEMKNLRWKRFPEKKVFISFCEGDKELMNYINNELKKSELLKPIVIEEKNEGAKILQDLIIKGINESSFYVSILSNISIKTQWVNQELGYAKSRGEELEIIPIVESIIIDDLKGFINRNNQLSYQFDNDRKSFEAACKAAINYMESGILKNIKRIEK